MNNLLTWAVYAGIVLLLGVGIHFGVKSSFDDGGDSFEQTRSARHHGPRGGDDAR